MITFDGARITAGSQSVNVIGVNPDTFRSWVPLRTASDQAFWTALTAGDFVAGTGAGKSLALKPGDSYRLVGSSAQTVKFGMAAKLGSIWRGPAGQPGDIGAPRPRSPGRRAHQRARR